jgi:probable rRNA maturation factor
VAIEQARTAEHSVQDELDLLCTHGILHLLGYDHADPEEHATMFSLQDRLLAAWSSERDPGSESDPESQGQESPGEKAGRESRGE